MRHRNRKIIRRALMHNLATSLILYETVSTTLAKAKLLRSFVEPLITAAKEGTLASRRAALAELTDKAAVQKLYQILGPKYKNRNGGYTRIRRTLKRRSGDAAETAVISLVE